MTITHAFVNPKADGPDATIVRPSDWNDPHVVDIAAAEVPFTPAGSISATNVQAAIEEVAAEAGSGAVASVNGQTGVVVLDLAAVLTAGNFVDGHLIQSADDATSIGAAIGLDDATATSGGTVVMGAGNTATNQGASLHVTGGDDSDGGGSFDGEAGQGGSGLPGGFFSFDAGAGDGGAAAGARLITEGGSGAGAAGKVRIKTNNSEGPGLLLSDGTRLTYSTDYQTSAAAAAAYDAIGAAAAAQAASQPLDSDLTAFAGLAIAADKLPYGTGSHTLGLADFTAAGRALVDDADASAQRTTLGLGTLATQSGTFSGTSSGTNTGDQDLSAYLTQPQVMARSCGA